MAWIVPIPPSPRHPHERYQVCYLGGKRQRSAGIFPTKCAHWPRPRPSGRAGPHTLAAPTAAASHIRADPPTSTTGAASVTPPGR
jgi:hypothetical protein